MNLKTLACAVVLLGVTATARAGKDDEAIRAQVESFFAAWNKNDVKGMASHFADDGTIINPIGRTANGKAEIEKLFTEEHAGVFKGSTAKVVSLTSKPLKGNMAWIDFDMTVEGAHGPDGSAIPQMKYHVAGLTTGKGGKWTWNEARAYGFQQPPPAPPAKP